MVVLTLTPYRGNHTRFFPHAGYLGLTPVVIQGTVRTVVQEDRKPLKARSVVIRVRCYEADISNVAAGKGKKKTPRVLYELSQEVWSCEGEEWGLLGDWSKAWRLVLPVDAGGVTTSTFKTWRSWWQVEAVIIHKPSTILGSRTTTSHQLPLTRYSASTLLLPPPSWSSRSSAPSFPQSKPPTPPPSGLHYSVSACSGVFGPNDPITLSLRFTRDNPSLVIKRIQVSLDRQLVVDVDAPSPSLCEEDYDDIVVPEDDSVFTPLVAEDDHHKNGRAGPTVPSVWRRRSSSTTPAASPGWTPPGEGSYFAPRPQVPGGGAITHQSGSSSTLSSRMSVTVLSFEGDAVSPFGTEFKVAGIVPKAKSMFLYSVGETIRTQLVNMSFTISVKITVKMRHGGTEVLELDPRPVVLTSASDDEREKALSQAGRLLALANAEGRLFDAPTPAPPADEAILPPKFSSIGARRSSGFSLMVNTDEVTFMADDVPSPARSLDSRDLHTKRSFTRKRSDQWEGVEAPAKSKPRFNIGADEPRIQFQFPSTDSLDNQDDVPNGLTLPASPALSDDFFSSFNAEPIPPSPPLSFQTFSLATRLPESLRYDRATRSQIAPWEVEDVGPFDRSISNPHGSPRRSSRPRPNGSSSPRQSSAVPASARSGSASPARPLGPSPSSATTVAYRRNSAAYPSEPVPRSVGDEVPRRVSADADSAHLRAPSDSDGHPGRRKSSAGFLLFGKTTGKEDEGPKEGGGWGFLRRGSKA